MNAYAVTVEICFYGRRCNEKLFSVKAETPYDAACAARKAASHNVAHDLRYTFSVTDVEDNGPVDAVSDSERFEHVYKVIVEETSGRYDLSYEFLVYARDAALAGLKGQARALVAALDEGNIGVGDTPVFEATCAMPLYPAAGAPMQEPSDAPMQEPSDAPMQEPSDALMQEPSDAPELHTFKVTMRGQKITYVVVVDAADDLDAIAKATESVTFHDNGESLLFPYCEVQRLS